MPIKRVNTSIYFVDDWDASITFYRDLLGLKPLVLVPRVWAQFEVPGGGRIVLRLQRRNGDDPPHVSLDVADIQGFVAELQTKGVRTIEPVSKQEFGDSARVEDPSGNAISRIDLSTSRVPHD